MNAPDTGAEVGQAADPEAGHDPPDQARLRQLADEQAALRRVATLVAGGARPAEVFTAVADELGRLIGAEATFVSRVDHPPGEHREPEEHGEAEGHLTVVGSYGRVSDKVPIGFRLKLAPGMVQTAALRTGRPARVNGEQLAKGPYGAWVGTLGMRAGVATPIVVGGRHWGVTVAATSQEDFPAGTESRMADFMELAAAAIANAKAEQELRELADTQAALRRLAMLVARGEPPEVVFAAVTREALRHFGGDTARMIRYELDGTATLLANEGTTGPHVQVGKRWEGYPPTGLTATVLRTGQAARVDDYRDVPGGEPYLREGLRSAVALPGHGEVRTEITDVATGLMGVIDELREISRGIHPAILSTAGLRPALRALGRRSAIPVNMDVRIDGRLPGPVEVGAYYVVSEMLTNAAKHARASVVEVDAEASGGTLRVSVRDDGVGGADPLLGSGLVGLKDRIEALGGRFSMRSPAGGGTTVSCELPVLASDGPPQLRLLTSLGVPVPPSQGPEETLRGSMTLDPFIASA